MALEVSLYTHIGKGVVTAVEYLAQQKSGQTQRERTRRTDNQLAL